VAIRDGPIGPSLSPRTASTRMPPAPTVQSTPCVREEMLPHPASRARTRRGQISSVVTVETPTATPTAGTAIITDPNTPLKPLAWRDVEPGTPATRAESPSASSTTERWSSLNGGEGDQTLGRRGGGGGRQVGGITGRAGRAAQFLFVLGMNGLDPARRRSDRRCGRTGRMARWGCEAASKARGVGGLDRAPRRPDRRGHHRQQESDCGRNREPVPEDFSTGHCPSNPRPQN
jgi:hypothetical protein